MSAGTGWSDRVEGPGGAGLTVRTLVVWCPDWSLTAASLGGSGPAVAVLDGELVVAASASARREGVVPGQRRREAQGHCPGIAVVERDHSLEARQLEAVAAAVETLCPEVEVRSPGSCAIGTRGPSRYLGGDEALVRRVDGVLAELGESRGWSWPWWRTGVADGPFAASQAARRAVVVPPGRSPDFLAALPVETLERPELTDLLRRLGIRTLGELAALPESDVVARFGSEGSWAHRMAAGRDDRRLEARVPPPDLVVTAELDPPADQVDRAAFAARAMAAQLLEQLGRLGLACSRVRVEAETEHGERRARSWGQDLPYTAPALAERMRWQLEGWLCGAAGARTAEAGASEPEDVPTAGLSLLRLVPEEVVRDGGRQPGLFGGEAEMDQRVARALARVQGMLGPEAVVTATLAGGRDPAERTLLVPWGEARPASSSLAAAGARSGRPGGARAAGEVRTWPGRLPPPAPALAYPAPLPAEVVGGDGRPVEVDGRGAHGSVPRRVTLGGGPWREVVAWAGPWPTDVRWWDRTARRRRARIQVVLEGGEAHLLALEGRRWWLEASYD
ncbi:MAG: DNA polymerase Y family protein [Acidimicrobiales bacterium]